MRTMKSKQSWERGDKMESKLNEEQSSAGQTMGPAYMLKLETLQKELDLLRSGQTEIQHSLGQWELSARDAQREVEAIVGAWSKLESHLVQKEVSPMKSSQMLELIGLQQQLELLRSGQADILSCLAQAVSTHQAELQSVQNYLDHIAEATEQQRQQHQHQQDSSSWPSPPLSDCPKSETSGMHQVSSHIGKASHQDGGMGSLSPCEWAAELCVMRAALLEVLLASSKSPSEPFESSASPLTATMPNRHRRKPTSVPPARKRER
eukprot:NODE_2294_length_1239_cov_31.497479_g2090_i0.p1 GENE.NODE_2294_length_1239_cov_31.497479_g2090_i0~~NODE_2294_length_1239_cov_31.497479_g2090_i0.p1  ORF type:complete len:264 (+),score=66.70 NODE_2294_length_1239_cov_31.497479_g2090_i0:310-1101(+)